MPTRPVVLRPDPPVAAWRFRVWELIAPRAPRWLIRLGTRAWRRLPLGSRARRWCSLGLAVIAYDATARDRPDLVVPLLHPAFEWRWDESFQALGLEKVYRGHEGHNRALADWNRVWVDATHRVREVLDGGDTMLTRLSVSGRGAGSGVPVDMEMNHVHRIDPRSGLVIDHRVFRDYAEALREAGFA